MISIHALREEGDQPLCGVGARPFDFYPRPPRGGRPAIYDGKKLFSAISIHALREEGDDIIQDYVLEGKKFLSTPSARRATSPESLSAAN